MREYAIAAIPADGIGQEAIAAGTLVLASLEKRLGDIKFNIENFDWGSDYYKKHGLMMPLGRTGAVEENRGYASS